MTLKALAADGKQTTTGLGSGFRVSKNTRLQIDSRYRTPYERTCAPGWEPSEPRGPAKVQEAETGSDGVVDDHHLFGFGKGFRI